jgi:hypothetical protein
LTNIPDPPTGYKTLREALDAIEEHERRKREELQPRPAIVTRWDKLTLPIRTAISQG